MCNFDFGTAKKKALIGFGYWLFCTLQMLGLENFRACYWKTDFQAISVIRWIKHAKSLKQIS
jgi:hypothetical protein